MRWRVVEALAADRVIFLPDGFLGRYVARHTDVEIIMWEGRCIVHERFSGEELEDLREMLPRIPVIAHPSARPMYWTRPTMSGPPMALSTG